MLQPRYLYAGLLIIAIGIAILFTYRTSAPPTLSAAIGVFGGVSLTIDYATTEAAREKGLGGRTSIPSDYGMLFVFPKDDVYGFWMKDMLVPIDIFWLDDKGQVISIMSDIATSSYPNVFYPSAPIRYVLETIAGFAHAHSIAIGTSLLLKDFPSVSE